MNHKKSVIINLKSRLLTDVDTSILEKFSITHWHHQKYYEDMDKSVQQHYNYIIL